ncbi:restriction endonuclease subunit S [Streptococcus thermophilus]|nr:restriction endonuclease subunit S [Streptococcus thermophilus]MCE2064271.1 restriction endonuclease subunit S [Streptococcus thermophilus]MCE2071867.1 restriction endonuclease subunit S [Streptococcus thermophilus]MCE2076804.1 restriction endonuclease subunit S [Streptococcus thermophilus]MCE2080286.1 restriction endonuclease subunit S [Streptococcus thermophilus]
MQMNIEWKILMNSFKVPRIRFKEFDVIWVEKRIADIVKISAGGDVDKIKLKESGKYPVIANALTNKGIVGFYDDYKVKAPAVTVTGRGDVGYAVARHENFTPIVRLLTLQSENIDVDYLENQINSMRILNESTGVPQLTAPQLGNYKVYHPEIEEQSAIGSLFRLLDDLLASYKDNLANYQSLKATMLSKMFPKAGQTVPEIRLDGFEGEWKIIRLGKVILEAYQGINTASDKVEYSVSGIPILQAKHITNGQINYKDARYLDMDIYEHYISKYMPKKGEILFANIGTIGPSVLVDTDEMFLIAWNILKMSIKDNYSPVFIKITLSLLDSKHIFGRITTGNATKFINKDEIMDIRIRVPSLLEQQAIGAYFSNLDQLITSYQEKITQLETLKKKLLQDMFI